MVPDSRYVVLPNNKPRPVCLSPLFSMVSLNNLISKPTIAVNYVCYSTPCMREAGVM